MLIVVIDEAADGVLQLLRATGDATPNLFLGQFGEPTLDQIPSITMRILFSVKNLRRVAAWSFGSEYVPFRWSRSARHFRGITLWFVLGETRIQYSVVFEVKK